MPQERRAKVNEEVDRFLAVGFNKLVERPKKNNQIRVCIDFTNLNKSCLMHPYPLPSINDLVDATVRYQWISFLDTFFRYNQIPLQEEDQIHTSFVIDWILYCYRVMPFGLKNIGATYQKFVNTIFKDLIGVTVEVYIINLVVNFPLGCLFIGPSGHAR